MVLVFFNFFYLDYNYYDITHVRQMFIRGRLITRESEPPEHHSRRAFDLIIEAFACRRVVLAI